MSNVEFVHFRNKMEEKNRYSFNEEENSEYHILKKEIMLEQFKTVSKHQTSDGFPMIVCESGHWHLHANEYITTRLNHPTVFNRADKNYRPFRKITKVSANNEADHLRNWLNICANNGVNYLKVTIDFLDAVIDDFRHDEDNEFDAVSEQSIATYINTWRLFYTFLDLIGVEHKLNFPAKIKQTRSKSNSEDRSDFLNHTKTNKQRRESKVFIDPLIDNRRKTKIVDYCSQVLTEDQIGMLIVELNKIDRVYAVMAHTQIDTLLRISELVEYFPHEEGNQRNKNWMNAAQMQLAGKAEQVFRFIGKGQVERRINVDIRTMKMISDYYITCKCDGSDKTLYNERTALYQRKYCNTKWAKRTGRTINNKHQWLTKKGRPVSKSMYRAAFGKALKVLRDQNKIEADIYVRPHALRHTGATLKLIKYGEKTGVDICMANIDDIHIVIQNLLGHADFQTTELYIATVRQLKIGGLARKAMLSQEDLWKGVGGNNDWIIKKGVDATLNTNL